MTHQLNLANLINNLKNDKESNPKWRNKIVSRLEEVECMMTKLSSREITKAELGNLEQHAPANLGVRNNCICGPNSPPYNPQCPQHGL